LYSVALIVKIAPSNFAKEHDSPPFVYNGHTYPKARGVFLRTVTSLAATDNSAKTSEGEPSNHQALVLDGRLVAKEVRQRCAQEVAALAERHSILPGLAVVRVGDDPAAARYAEGIRRTFSAANLSVTAVELPGDVSRALFQAELGRLNVLPEIAGILVLMPLPRHLPFDALIDALDPKKDIEGIAPINIGRLALGLDCYVPSTPAGGIALLDHYRIPIEGKHAVIVGRSGVVGKPLAQLLLARNATVTIAHSHTTNLPDLLAEADILATATGRPALIKGHMIKPGAAVLDFGVAILEGKMVGDVDYESALAVARAITPVPGGTGPMTNVMLLKNTIKAIRRYLG
jgi:methylenetetrahydrofolate dehydrogenase (NADP+)/methenyltetrahydrofolate cyclohydrolase